MRQNKLQAPDLLKELAALPRVPILALAKEEKYMSEKNAKKCSEEK